MKKTLVLLMVILSLMIAGCSSGYSKTISDDMYEKFHIIDDQNNGMGFTRIIVDQETGVMYLFHKSGYGGGMTLMVDSEGKPLLYNK